MLGNLTASVRRDVMNLPMCWHVGSICSSLITSSTARPAAQASGEPANVRRVRRGSGESMMSALPITAESGTPPDTLLAIVMRSGSTAEYSTGKHPARACQTRLNLIDDEAVFRAGRTSRAAFAATPTGAVETTFASTGSIMMAANATGRRLL